MKTSILALLLAPIMVLGGCVNQTESQLAIIDVTKGYPEKEIKLSELADVSYVQLKADSDYLFRGQPIAITKNNIVVYDRSAGSILFFAIDGTPKSRFNHKGNGPGEYVSADNALYDEAKDELYTTSSSQSRKIEVYSSAGEHKRTLPVPQRSYVFQLFPFDESTLFLHDNRAMQLAIRRVLSKVTGRAVTEDEAGDESYPKPFVRISKTDGSPVSYVDMPENNEISLVADLVVDGNMIGAAPAQTNRIIRYKDAFLLCNPETDTIFLCNKDLSLTPLLVQTPSVRTLKPEVFFNNMLEAGAYQFIEYLTLKRENNRFPSTILARDKKSGDVYKAKIKCDEFEGKELPLSTFLALRTESGTAFAEWDLSELKQALSANKLSGKLKDLVEASDGNEDNNIYVLLQFK